MSGMTAALILSLVGALASTIVAPPALPPEPAPVQDPPQTQPPEQPNPITPPGGTNLPPGLQPIPFPLEHQRRAAPPTGDASNPITPTNQRRSIVDLRDPFNRPPARPRSEGQRDPKIRLLMPDLKDPFAPGLRRVRSKTLDLRIPNDIRDPFRPRPKGKGKAPACAKTTGDGTVVQKPGKQPVSVEECVRSSLDLRDPFDRDPNR